MGTGHVASQNRLVFIGIERVQLGVRRGFLRSYVEATRANRSDKPLFASRHPTGHPHGGDLFGFFAVQFEDAADYQKAFPGSWVLRGFLCKIFLDLKVWQIQQKTASRLWVRWDTQGNRVQR